MKRLLFLFLLFFIISCNTKEITKADLSFKLISYGSFYGVKNNELNKIEKVFDSILIDSKINKKDKELYSFFKRLKNKGLLNYPNINIHFSKDSTMVVYLSDKEYKKVKQFTLKDLEERHKKVELELQIVKVDKDIYYAEKILSVKEVDGITFWKK